MTGNRTAEKAREPHAVAARDFTQPVLAVRREMQKWQRHFADRAGLNKLVRGRPDNHRGRINVRQPHDASTIGAHAGVGREIATPIDAPPVRTFRRLHVLRRRWPGRRPGRRERGSAKIVEIGAGVGIPSIALVWHLLSPSVGLFLRSAHSIARVAASLR
jgi:hypothetical protein